MWKNGLIKKISLISQFMTSQPRKQAIAIHILPSISRSKGNKAMKFGQLIEYNKTNNFLERSYTKCSGEAIPRSFFEKSKLRISLDQHSEILFSLFYWISRSRNTKIPKYIETKGLITCLHLL